MATTHELLKYFTNRGLLLHGSPNKFEILQGRPLYATPLPFMAILYACCPRLKKIEYAKYSPSGEIRASKNFIKNMHPGYVYVLRKDLFRLGKAGEGELIAYDPVNPAGCTEVTPDDLPYPVVECAPSELKALSVGFGQARPIKKGFRDGVGRT